MDGVKQGNWSYLPLALALAACSGGTSLPKGAGGAAGGGAGRGTPNAGGGRGGGAGGRAGDAGAPGAFAGSIGSIGGSAGTTAATAVGGAGGNAFGGEASANGGAGAVGANGGAGAAGIAGTAGAKGSGAAGAIGSCDSVCTANEVCLRGICRGTISRWTTLGGDVHHSGYNANETGTPPLSPAWTATLASRGGLWPVVSDGTVLYVAENGYFDQMTLMWALDPADGHTLWKHDFGDIHNLGQPTVDRGHVYVAQSDSSPGSFMYSFVASSLRAT